MKITSKFIAKQLARLKSGQSYYALFAWSVMMVSSVKAILPSIQLEFIILLVPLGLVGAWFIGFYTDKNEIFAEDFLKTNEMAHRNRIMPVEVKNFSFQMAMNQALLDGIAELMGKPKIDHKKILDKYYEEFSNNWTNGGDK